MSKYMRRARTEVMDSATGLYPTDHRRLWRDVRKAGEDECWEWIGPTNEDGYGILRAGGRPDHAHRVAYRVSRADHIPKGLEVCHTCDTPSCVNPKHLFLGTHKENIQDCKRKGRHKPPPIGPGEEAHSAKLTDGEVRAIRAMAEYGTSQSRIAAAFGITQGNVSQIVLRKTWRHI